MSVNMASAEDLMKWGYNAYNNARSAGYGNLRGPPKVPYKRRYPKYRRASNRGLLTRMPAHNYVRRCTPINFAANQASGITDVQGTTITSPGFGFSMEFTLNNVIIKTGTQSVAISTLSSDFTNLYDMYKIRGIRVDFYWSNNDSYPGNSYVIPLLQSAIDYDNSNIPTTSNELTQYSTFKVDQLDKKRVSRYLAPKVSMAINTPAGGGGNTGSAVSSSPFISTDSPDTVHGGLKFWFDNYASAVNVGTGRVAIYVTYFITCKGSR